MDVSSDAKSEMKLVTPQEAESSDLALPPPVTDESRIMVPAKLSFSFEHARMHLIRADPRFEDVFERMKCKPFEHLEQFDPFR